jgi:hypothetical protein
MTNNCANSPIWANNRGSFAWRGKGIISPPLGSIAWEERARNFYLEYPNSSIGKVGGICEIKKSEQFMVHLLDAFNFFFVPCLVRNREFWKMEKDTSSFTT